MDYSRSITDTLPAKQCSLLYLGSAPRLNNELSKDRGMNRKTYPSNVSDKEQSVFLKNQQYVHA